MTKKISLQRALCYWAAQVRAAVALHIAFFTHEELLSDSTLPSPRPETSVAIAEMPLVLLCRWAAPS